MELTATSGPLVPVVLASGAALPITLPVSLNTSQGLGIPIALAGAVFLSLGAQFQHRGVQQLGRTHAGEPPALGIKGVLRLVTRPSWAVGTLMLILAVGMQLASLRYAPLIVVQPLGVVALVVTAILNSRVAGVKLDRRAVRAIALCLLGVGVFVAVAAPSSVDPTISDAQMLTIIIIASVVVAAVWVVLTRFRSRIKPVGMIVLAGVQAGLVASMAKTVINRVIAAQFDVHQLPVLTIIAGIYVVGLTVSSMYTVQSAYAVGPPDLVIAGLTVIDPLMAVTIGVVVLGEAAGSPWWAVVIFVLAGATAVFGVVQLARNHPQVRR